MRFRVAVCCSETLLFPLSWFPAFSFLESAPTTTTTKDTEFPMTQMDGYDSTDFTTEYIISSGIGIKQEGFNKYPVLSLQAKIHKTLFENYRVCGDIIVERGWNETVVIPLG